MTRTRSEQCPSTARRRRKQACALGAVWRESRRRRWPRCARSRAAGAVPRTRSEESALYGKVEGVRPCNTQRATESVPSAAGARARPRSRRQQAAVVPRSGNVRKRSACVTGLDGSESNETCAPRATYQTARVDCSPVAGLRVGPQWSLSVSCPRSCHARCRRGSPTLHAGRRPQTWPDGRGREPKANAATPLQGRGCLPPWPCGTCVGCP